MLTALTKTTLPKQVQRIITQVALEAHYEVLDYLEAYYASPDVVDDPTWRAVAKEVIQLTSKTAFRKYLRKQDIMPKQADQLIAEITK